MVDTVVLELKFWYRSFWISSCCIMEGVACVFMSLVLVARRQVSLCCRNRSTGCRVSAISGLGMLIVLEKSKIGDSYGDATAGRIVNTTIILNWHHFGKRTHRCTTSHRGEGFGSGR
jgi:hypothetical protein